MILQKKYVDYLESVREELIEAERKVDSIKKSPEWKACINYFNVLRYRGKIEQIPTKENGYSYKTESRIVLDLEELAEIVTPEQLARIVEKVKEGYK